jgi:tetratricopeptide (TPR) repeat protein
MSWMSRSRAGRVKRSPGQPEHREKSASGLSNLAVQETNEPSWKQPLKGWRWLVGWAVLMACLVALTRMVLGMTIDQSFNAAPGALWLLCLAIPLLVVISIGLFVRCLSSWRNFKRLLLGLTWLAGLIVMFYAEEDLRGRIAWGHFKTQWEAKGETFDLAAFIPPPVPDEGNFAMTPLVATSYGQILDRNGHRISPPNTNVVNQIQMPVAGRDGGPTDGIGNWQKAIRSDLEPWQRYYRKLSLTTNLFPVPQQPQTPAADVLLALSKYDSTIEELRAAAALPASRFPLNYDCEEPYSILLPHLAPMKGCAIVLRLRALAELEAGQSDRALADISLALRLSEKIRSEPFLISQLVRIAMLQITTQAVWEGLAKQRWTDAQLSELDQQLAALDSVADYQRAMRAENALQVASTDFLRQHPNQLCNMDFIGEGESVHLPEIPGQMIPSGWFYQNQLRSSKFILDKFLPIGDVRKQTISPSLAKEANQSLCAMRLSPYSILCKMFLPELVSSPRKFALGQATVNLARTACALERYRLAHGTYPQTLDALAPRFVGTVPDDPIGCQPLHYRPTNDRRFVLYSVGWNERDEGGTVSLANPGTMDWDKRGPVNSEDGDWVWQYPALRKP